ncbi:hypothetical protein [Photobacterium leiognathi]|uniref:hypothetical protein n=1 Tax=Photobacterium leiognathi TaxID=553611 RepID=UPI0029812CDA|nr:hypothetical protein [Photobacterium leiognathi]
MDNLEHRVYRAKQAQQRIKYGFDINKVLGDYEKRIDQERERAALIDYKNKIKGEFHIIEQVAYRKHNPNIMSLLSFLNPFEFATVSATTMSSKGRKWLTDNLTGKSKATLNQFMDIVEKHNKTEKDASKRYYWDIISLSERDKRNRKVRVKNQFILRVRLSPTNGLFIGIQDDNWCIFY